MSERIWWASDPNSSSHSFAAVVRNAPRRRKPWVCEIHRRFGSFDSKLWWSKRFRSEAEAERCGIEFLAALEAKVEGKWLTRRGTDDE